MQIKTPLPLFDTLDNLNILEQNHEGIPASYLADYRHSALFLYSYRGSSATFNAYRREIERLLQWTWFINNKPLHELKSVDIEHFIEFCQSPPLNWIGNKNVARFISKNGIRIVNPQWRPFVVAVNKSAHKAGQEPKLKDYQLSQKALQAIFAITGSFFNYLLQQEYVMINPVAQIRQKSKFIRRQQGQTPIRRLSETQWAYVIATCEAMAEQNPKHERTLFIMNALFGMYLRISELTASPRWEPQMGHFHQDSDGHWWFRTVGKGNKERLITVSDAMLNALQRYRRHLGISPLPAIGETTPLLMKNRGKGPITSTRQIRHLVQQCFDTAMEQLQNDGFRQEAQQLAAATVHWLRHTGISEDVKIRPREHVRDDAGHSSSAITDRYIDIQMRERHASGRSKKIKPDEEPIETS